MVCLRNMSVDIMHRGDTEDNNNNNDDDDDNNNNNNNNNNTVNRCFNSLLPLYILLSTYDKAV